MAVREKSVRGTISNRLPAKDSDPAKLNAKIENPNLQTVDVVFQQHLLPKGELVHRGALVGIASVAGIRGLPGHGAWASAGAVRVASDAASGPPNTAARTRSDARRSK